MLTIHVCESDSHGQPGKRDPHDQWRTQNCAGCFGLLESMAAPQHCKSQQFQHGSLHVIPHLTHQTWNTGVL